MTNFALKHAIVVLAQIFFGPALDLTREQAEAAEKAQAQTRTEYLATAYKDLRDIIRIADKDESKVITGYMPEKDARNISAEDLYPISDLREIVTPFYDGSPKDCKQYKVISDFSEQLRQYQVRLILVPVPTKPMIYYDRLTDAVPDAGRIDPQYEWFYKELNLNGWCTVADPTTEFLKYRKYYKLYWMSDTRWTSVAAMIAAKTATESVSICQMKSYHDIKINDYMSTWVTATTVQGRLQRGHTPTGPEFLETVLVGKRYPTGVFAQQPIDSNSENLIMGDECVQLFHNPDPRYHGPGAGFPDHFARLTQSTVDVLYGDVSDVNACRRELVNHPERLKGKKRVFFCFSAAAFSKTLWDSSIILPKPPK